MPKCSFCSASIEQGTGKLFVSGHGKPLWFCSGKCESFSLRGTSAKKLKWTRR
ncbi:MAG: 50S ribosomal protein L24e [Candidatus Aenigmarchaeota archaeon]|nr:50S ribosomal protein L24e [Candidatus Aenigmarchaeota archaeon]